MTDTELVAKLLSNDSRTIYEFFFVRCRGMLSYVGAYFGNVRMLPEEMIGEFYEFLSADDWHKLRIFKFSCSLNSYVTIIASRYFQRKRERELLSLDDEEMRIPQPSPVVQSEHFLYDVILRVMENMAALDRMLLQRILLEGNKPSDVLWEVLEYIPKEKREGYSHDQLAGYVYTRYNRAKKALQKELILLGYYKN